MNICLNEMMFNCQMFVLEKYVPPFTTNVLRIDVGGLSELPVSTRTNVYIKIQMFLFPRPPAYVYLLLARRNRHTGTPWYVSAVKVYF